MRSMTSHGSPYARFRRALATENITVALASARELPRISLDDALRLCWILRGSDLYERAVIRWLGRFLLECPGATLAELRMASSAFDDLAAGWMPENAIQRLTALAEKHGLTSSRPRSPATR